MSAADRNGLDLYAVTRAKLGGYELSEFMAMKICGEPVKEAFYSLIRDKAKPANLACCTT